MTAPTLSPTAISGRATAKPRRRRRGSADISSRPGFLGYGLLIATLLGAILPLYWAFLIASGGSSTLNNVNMPWWPGGNFANNAWKVVSNERVLFFKAVLNSLIVSTVVSASVVFFSTLAGYSFAKLRFRGSRGLFIFVIATTAVPTQLGVVPLFIVMSQLGWTGTLGAVIVPGLVTAFGVFWMTFHQHRALPLSSSSRSSRRSLCSDVLVRIQFPRLVPPRRRSTLHLHRDLDELLLAVLRAQARLA